MIQARLADNNKAGETRVSAERFVEIGVNARTNGLEGQAHRLAFDRREPFET